MVRNSPRQSVAVILQLSEKIDWLNCVEFINRLPKETVFFLITPTEDQSEIFSLLAKQAQEAQVFCCEYKGTYIGGLATLLRKYPIHEFTLVLHLHAYHSDFYAFVPYEVWLTQQYEGLLPNGRTHLIFDFFEKNPKVGIAGPHSSCWPIAKQFINESAICYWNKLTDKLSSSDFPNNPLFFVNGMFWARGSIFKDFADLDLDLELCELQNSENEESFTQALERYFSVIAHKQGLTVSSFDFSDFKPWLSKRILNALKPLLSKSF